MPDCNDSSFNLEQLSSKLLVDKGSASKQSYGNVLSGGMVNSVKGSNNKAEKVSSCHQRR